MIEKSDLKTKFIKYEDGSPSSMSVECRDLEIGKDEWMLKIKAIGINRAECLQRSGKYKVSKDKEKYLGLEAAGEVIDPNTKEKVMDGIALLSGGSYSQWATVPKGHIMPLPQGFTYQQGAAIPEAWLTAFQIIRFANLSQGDNVVIYAAASGVGTAAIQICSLLRYNAFAVVSSEEKLKLCISLGAKGGALYTNNKIWAEELIKLNEGKRFNAVLDCVGAGNFESTVDLLDIDARWVLYGLLSGGNISMNLGALMAKRIQLITTLLKPRSEEYKDNLVAEFSQKVLPGFEKGVIKPVIYEVLEHDWNGESADSFVKAHQLMESNINSGKIVINYV